MSTTLNYSETAETPLALLAKGERQIAAGQYREGSATVYQAAITALREVAAQRGWVCETHEDARAITHRLDNVVPPATFAEAITQAFERVDDPLPVYSILFTTAYCFKHHSRLRSPDGTLPTTFWEPEDYVKSLPLVKKFIDLIEAELRAEAANEP